MCKIVSSQYIAELRRSIPKGPRNKEVLKSQIVNVGAYTAVWVGISPCSGKSNSLNFNVYQLETRLWMNARQKVGTGKGGAGGGPDRLSQLIICLQLRSWSRGTEIEPYIGLPAQWEACFYFSFCCSPLLVLSFCLINK